MFESEEPASCQHAASAAHFRKMYDRISDLAKIGVWECDLATEKLTWTDMVYDLFELPRGSVLDRNETLKFYEASSRREMERLRSAAIRSGTGFTLDILIHTAAGIQRWIRLTADIEQEDGKPTRIFGTKQDISAERAAQEKMQRLQTELIHVSRVSAMDAMGSTLAHEVNQPLTAASNYMAAARRLAARGTVTPELAHSIDAAMEAALRAGEIIRRVREMSAKGQAAKEEFELEDMVREAGALAAAVNPDIVITWDLVPQAPVKADRIQVQQVLINLIRNACEAAGGPSCDIGIRSSKSDTHLEVCVSDSGPGISEEILPHVFDSFVTTKPNGLGIGLSVSRTIIEAHGGSITAVNSARRGAALCFTLPLSKPQPASPCD